MSTECRFAIGTRVEGCNVNVRSTVVGHRLIGLCLLCHAPSVSHIRVGHLNRMRSRTRTRPRTHCPKLGPCYRAVVLTYSMYGPLSSVYPFQVSNLWRVQHFREALHLVEKPDNPAGFGQNQSSVVH